MSEPNFLVTQPIPEPGMSALRTAGRVYVFGFAPRTL